jgi:hypothetical protein
MYLVERVGRSYDSRRIVGADFFFIRPPLERAFLSVIIFAGMLGANGCSTTPTSCSPASNPQADDAQDTCPNGDVCDLMGRCATPQYTAANGVVKDGVTGLEWQQNVSTGPCVAMCPLTDAETYCSTLTLGGSGWRLPTLAELFSIVEMGTAPMIDKAAFPGAASDQCWSSSPAPPVGGNNGQGWWFVDFTFGDTQYAYDHNGIYYSHGVRCVR